MSYKTWHIYGIGVNTSKIDTSVQKILNLINIAPEFAAEIKSKISDEHNLDMDELTNILNDCRYCCYCDNDAVSMVLSNVINELEDINITYTTNFDNESFCVFSPMYPWNLNEREKNLTYEALEDIFAKYIAYLTDQTLPELYYGEQEIENGG